MSQDAPGWKLRYSDAQDGMLGIWMLTLTSEYYRIKLLRLHLFTIEIFIYIASTPFTYPTQRAFPTMVPF